MSADEGSNPRRVDLRAVLLLLALLAPLLLVGDLIDRMTALGRTIDPDRAYLDFLDSAAFDLRLPLALVGVFSALLVPGIVLVRLFARRARSVESLILDGLAAGLVLNVVLVLLRALREPGAGSPGLVPILVAVTACAALLVPRAPAPPTRGVAGFLLWCLLPTVLLATMAAPKIFWESATGDGAHAFEASRRLLESRFPFFPADTGSMSSYPGPNSLLQGFVTAPLLAMLGADIAAARLVFFLALGLLAAAMRGLLPAELRDRWSLNVLIWLALTAAALALGWSAGYDPYGADLALPGAQDLLLMALFVGALGAWARSEHLRFVVLALLVTTTSPGGGLLLLFLAPARFLARGHRPFRAAVAVGLLVVLALSLHAALGQIAQRWWGMEAGDEHGLRPLLRKLRFLDLGDWQRFTWLLAGGIFPLSILFAWRRLNVEARVAAITAIASFAFFYPLIKTNLHYFAPAMILPLSAWLLARRAAPRGTALMAALGLGLASVALCLPRTGAVVTAARTAGGAIDLAGVPGYESFEPAALRATDALALFFASDHDLAVPERLYGGSPLSWNYHSRRAGPAAEKIMAVLPEGVAAAEGAVEIGRASGFVAWVMNPAAWEDMQAMKPRDTRGPRFLIASKERMFGSRELEKRPGVIDLREIQRALGLISTSP